MKKLFLLLAAGCLVLGGCNGGNKPNNDPGTNDNGGGNNGNNGNNDNGNNGGNTQKVVASLGQVHAPSAIEQGSIVNKSDFQVDVTYSDSTTGRVTPDSVDLDTSTVGDAVVGTVHVGTLTATFTIMVYSTSAAGRHGTFTTEGGSFSEGTGYTDIELKNANSESLMVRAERISINEDVLVAEHSSYFVIYNQANYPLNDVAVLASGWQHASTLASSEYLNFALYFSYNFLTLDDIFAGRYQDLQTMTTSFPVSGAGNNFSTTAAGISAPNARYFLAVIQTPSVDLRLTSLQVVSNSESAPAAVEKGYFAYPADINTKLPGFSNGFPYIGNGSYFVTQMMGTYYGMSAFQRTGKFNEIVEAFTNDGFNYATEYYGYPLYQKLYSGNQYYSYALTKSEFNGFESIQIIYAGLMGNMVTTDGWPVDEIRSYFSNEQFKSRIEDLAFSGSISCLVDNREEDGNVEVSVSITNNAGTKEQFVSNATLLKNYAHKFITDYGYTLYTEYDADFTLDEFMYTIRVIAADSRTEMTVSIYYSSSMSYSSMVISFVELYFGEFPLSVIRETFSDPTLPGLISANGTFNVYSNNPNYTSIKGLGVTNNELLVYSETLEAYGYSSYQSSNHIYLNKFQISDDGAYTFYIDLSLDSNNVATLTYSVQDANEYTKFSDAIQSLSLEFTLSPALAEELEWNDGSFVVDSSKGHIYCFGYGQDEANELIALCEYDAALSGYIYCDAGHPINGALKINYALETNYLVLTFVRIGGADWSIYSGGVDVSAINSQLDAMFESRSITEDTAIYNFSSSDVKYVQISPTYFYIMGADAISVAQDYIDSLLSDANIKHSEFNGKYYNTANSVAVEFSFSEGAGIPTATVCFTFNETFVDYVKYSELDFGTFAYISLFPTLDIAGNEKVFLKGENWDAYNIEIYLTQEIYDAYLTSLSATSFVYNDYDNVYQLTDNDGNCASVEFYDLTHSIHLSYELAKYNTIASIKADNPSNVPLSDSVLPDFEGKAFYASRLTDELAIIAFDPGLFNETAKTAYASYLVSEGYEVSKNYYGDPCYVKHGVSDTNAITIGDGYLALEMLSFTHNSLEDYYPDFTTAGFDTDKLNNFVTTTEMESNFYKLNASTNELEMLIVNEDFTVNEYEEALDLAGFSHNSVNNSWSKGTTVIEIDDFYGFVKITYHDERVIYVSMATVIDRAIHQTFKGWIVEYFELPNQSGNIYGLRSSGSESININVSEDFDFQAYASQLLANGYTYQYGDYYNPNTETVVTLYENDGYFVIYYYGDAYATIFYFDSLFAKHDITLSSQIDYPDFILGREINDYWTSLYGGSNGVYFLDIEYVDIVESDRESVEVFGNVVVFYYEEEDIYYGAFTIYDLEDATENTIYDVFAAYGYSIDEYDGYSDIEDIALKDGDRFLLVDDAEDVFNALVTFFGLNTSNLEEYNFDSEEKVLTIRKDGGSPFIIISIVNDTILRIENTY